MTLSEAVRYDPFSSQAHADPYETYRQLRDHAPVYRNAEHGFWALSRFADVQAAAREWRTYSNAPGVDLGGFANLFGAGDFLDVDPPSHDALRNVIRHQFAPRAIGELEDFTREQTRALLAELADEGECDVAARFALELPVRVVTHLVGLEAEERPPIFALCAELIDQAPGQADPTARQLAARAEVRERLGALARRGGPAGTILGDVADAVRGGAMTVAEAEGMLLLVCVAGFETTASLLSHAIYLLAVHRDQRELLRADRSLIPHAVEEIVRYEAPIQIMARTALCDVEIDGTTIPADDRVVLLYGSANRDERRFEDPDRFDVTRPKLRHLGFGEGIHHCLGAPLARLEGRILIEQLLDDYPDWELTGPIVRPPSHNARGISSLPVRLR